jgi:two-component system cell cycle response regulator
MFYRLVGDVSSAHTHAVQGVVHLTGDIVPTIRARHLLTLAVALDENGHSADGDRRFQEALDIAMSLGDGELTVHILNNMAYTAYEREDEPLARALTDQMREVEARDSFSLSAGQLDTIARVEMMSGRYDSAAATFREMANRDALTGLYDRRYIDERLPALLGEAASRRPISLAIVDLDHFKRVNDTLSHGVGDTVLQHIGRLLSEAATGTAIAARLGGEEFVIILPGVDAEEAQRRCETPRLRIRAQAWAPITGPLR